MSFLDKFKYIYKCNRCGKTIKIYKFIIIINKFVFNSNTYKTCYNCNFIQSIHLCHHIIKDNSDMKTKILNSKYKKRISYDNS